MQIIKTQVVKKLHFHWLGWWQVQIPRVSFTKKTEYSHIFDIFRRMFPWGKVVTLVWLHNSVWHKQTCLTNFINFSGFHSYGMLTGSTFAGRSCHQRTVLRPAECTLCPYGILSYLCWKKTDDLCQYTISPTNMNSTKYMGMTQPASLCCIVVRGFMLGLCNLQIGVPWPG